jgi:hypothetical protein
MTLSYISNWASPFGRTLSTVGQPPKIKHINLGGSRTACGRTLKDPYWVPATSHHRVCPRCLANRQQTNAGIPS